MITRAALVAEARLWVGTPYRPRTAKPGQGADCAFLQHVLRGALGTFPIRMDYPMLPKNREIEKEMDKRLDVVWRIADRSLQFSDLKAGRVALFEFAKDEPQHMGMVAHHPNLPDTARTIIHATGSPTRRGKVAESTLCSVDTLKPNGETRSALGTLIKLYDVKGVIDG